MDTHRRKCFLSIVRVYSLLCGFCFVFQTQNLHVQTKGGNVICVGTVYGNIDIQASDHSVRLKLSDFSAAAEPPKGKLP